MYLRVYLSTPDYTVVSHRERIVIRMQMGANQSLRFNIHEIIPVKF